MSPEVQASIISATGSVISTLIGALAAALIGKRFMSQDRLKKDLNTAIADIAFLLAVEREHCEQNKKDGKGSCFQKVRSQVRHTQSWSGKFTPGRIKGISDDSY